MLERKIYSQIQQFFENNMHKALMITGARQVGKSFIIEEYAKNHFKHFIKLDFIAHPEYVSVFSDANSADDILLRISAINGADLVPGESLIFFDEVQECKELITH